jgi:hypothetical protein
MDTLANIHYNGLQLHYVYCNLVNPILQNSDNLHIKGQIQECYLTLSLQNTSGKSSIQMCSPLWISLS